jgi:hypothetical protein
MLFYTAIIVSYAVGFIYIVRVYLRSVETIRNVLILNLIIKISKEIVRSQINC